MNRVSAIIVAAGEGKRFGSRKQFALLKGKPVLDWCLEKFDAHTKIAEIVLVLEDEVRKNEYLERYRKVVDITRGGERRQDSVLAGFHCLDPNQAEIVLVHDGVRPLVGKDLISRVIEFTLERRAVIPAVPLEETVKLVEGQEVRETIDRTKLFRIQTPQGFFYSLLKRALDRACKDNFYGTDEASLVERIGQKVFIVSGDSGNIKITTLDDLKVAEALLED